MFRLKQKHSQPSKKKYPKPDVKRILAEESLLRGILGSVAVAALLCWIWAVQALTTGRVYPWISILIGILIGLAMQRFGRGLDWRFPLIGGLVAGVAAYAGNLMIGVLETGRYIEAQPLQVIAGLSMDTMRYFFRNTISVIDHIYAFCSAGVAAFFSIRRLNRREILALRAKKKARN
jgi:hypothetical protein